MSKLKVTEVQSDKWVGSDSTEFIPCRAIATISALSASTYLVYSKNVSSVIDNGAGDTTVNFAKPMPHANYSIACLNTDVYNGNGNVKMHANNAASAPTLKTAGSVRITTSFDVHTVTLAVFA